MIDPELRSLLVCPVDHGELTDDHEGRRLVCTVCGRRYPVRDGIPVMLVDEAEMPDDGEG
ncbi:MAG TPA: Trm112 family protein [Acidimicrobiia bacterium]|nr:Trm112 family protein [Acidimicrobiia bacterium]